MATVHNPTNFEPSHYEVQDYFDNRRPAYYGQPLEAYEQEVKCWEQELAAVYGPHWQSKVFKCVHCGNGNVRWITATKHLPTGDVVTFGCDCTERLGFKNQVQFKLALLQAKAEAGHAKVKIWNARCAFLDARPEFAAAVEQAKGELHQKNTFVQDVIGKLNQFGSLSDRQVSAVIASLKRDVEKAQTPVVEEVKGPAPVGRVTVTGTVLSLKQVEGAYGWQTKALLKLTNNSRVWLSAPAKAGWEKGVTVTVTATFEVSKDDPSFGFGKRPVAGAVPAAV